MKSFRMLLALCGGLSLILGYMTTAFILWDLDISNYEQKVRMMIAATPFLFFYISLVLIVEQLKDKK